MTNEKADLWQKVKDSPAVPDKSYQDYTVGELQQLLESVTPKPVPSDQQRMADALGTDNVPGFPSPDPDEFPEVVAGFEELAPVDPPDPSAQFGVDYDAVTEHPLERVVPVRDKDPNELPAQRQNTGREEWEPIRVDPETGRVWYQEEVLKKGYAAPRGRRVLRYQETGSRKQTILGQSGEVVEEFEVAGGQTPRTAEARITLPSYQTGIFKDPRYPFKIHTYNGNNGFDLADVAEYYGGVDRVPDTIKRCYVENDLCWDIRSTIKTIQDEYRHLQLTGKIR